MPVTSSTAAGTASVHHRPAPIGEATVQKAVDALNQKMFGATPTGIGAPTTTVPKKIRDDNTGFDTSTAYRLHLDDLVPGAGDRVLYAVRDGNPAAHVDEMRIYDASGKKLAHGELNNDHPGHVGFFFDIMVTSPRAPIVITHPSSSGFGGSGSATPLTTTPGSGASQLHIRHPGGKIAIGDQAVTGMECAMAGLQYTVSALNESDKLEARYVADLGDNMKIAAGFLSPAKAQALNVTGVDSAKLGRLVTALNNAADLMMNAGDALGAAARARLEEGNGAHPSPSSKEIIEMNDATHQGAAAYVVRAMGALFNAQELAKK